MTVDFGVFLTVSDKSLLKGRRFLQSGGWVKDGAGYPEKTGSVDQADRKFRKKLNFDVLSKRRQKQVKQSGSPDVACHGMAQGATLICVFT